MNETTAGPPLPVRPRPRRPFRRLLAPLVTLGASAAAFACVGAVDPGEPGHYPACPLLRATGVFCPGCGGLRAAHAVVHGDFAAAFGLNGLAVLGFLAFAVFLPVWSVRAARGRRTYPPFRAVHWWLIGGVTAVFTIVRNLPFGSVLAP